MGSSRVNCEIIKANEAFGPQDEDQSPSLRKRKPHGKYVEDEINKLFESINLRASKSFDLTYWPRKVSKKPIRSAGSQSPVIEFSGPVSLKQALRGMCISQAAEMAAVKRLSMPASPRISESGKPVNSCGPVEVEAGSSTYSAENPIWRNKDSYFKKPATQSSCSSPNCIVSIECVSSVDGKSTRCFQEPESNSKNQSASSSFARASELVGSSKILGSNSASELIKADNKGAPKSRRKSKSQNVPSSSLLKSNKDVRSTRPTSRSVKPLAKNKNIVIKKPKKVAVSSRTRRGENIRNPGQKPAQVICQKCRCSSETTTIDPVKDSPSTTGVRVRIKKSDLSQSSKSSICDFSSSTTSLSEDRSLNGLTTGNRPHMSKDTKWGAINRIRKQDGFLGLSHFNLLRKLGSGDIGTVYLAELIGGNHVFAIKVMDNEFLSRRKKMARAQTEREILRMLDHPFLPALYAQFTSDNLSCLVMEFCPGGDLHVLRQKQPGRYFPEQAARFYVAEVLLALEYLHMLGIIYRDLKPENILVREDGHIMLTDFDLSLRCSVNPTLVKSSALSIEPPRMSGPCTGSNCIDPFCTGPSCQVSCFSPRILPASARARKLKTEAAVKARSLPQLVAEPSEARSNSFVGTHEYLAPEIIKGEGHGSAVDWWMFGVLLYELLYGRTPFKGVCNEETLANVVLRNLRFPDSPMFSFQARDLIRRLLVKEPENRLGTETGAAEIKKHPFFTGLNWALIRCEVPPQIPEFYDVGILEKGKRFAECSRSDEHLEFELF
ncbi:hypothetical protein OROGR_017697 [Orobanche gracilis]